MESSISIIFVIFLAQSTYGLPATTLAPEDITTQKVTILDIWLSPDLCLMLQITGSDPNYYPSGDQNSMLEQLLQ